MIFLRRWVLPGLAACFATGCAPWEPDDDDFQAVALITGHSRQEVFDAVLDLLDERGYTVQVAKPEEGRLKTDWRYDLHPFSGVRGAQQGSRERVWALVSPTLEDVHQIGMIVHREYNREMSRTMDREAADWSLPESVPEVAETLGMLVEQRLGALTEDLGALSPRMREILQQRWRNERAIAPQEE